MLGAAGKIHYQTSKMLAFAYLNLVGFIAKRAVKKTTLGIN